MSRYAVVGATSWGLTLASLIAANGHEVTVVTRSESEAEAVRRRPGIERLPELKLADSIQISRPLTGEDFAGVVMAVPSQSLRATVATCGVSRATPLLSAAKGIELSTGLLMTEVLTSLGWKAEDVAAVSGPNLAHEIVRGLPAAAVVASISVERAEMWQAALSRPTFRTYTSEDITGVQFAGAYKNVIAIAAGACWGLHFGANAVSTVMTRGLAEMTRLGVALGAEPSTFLGLAGVGDLATTCFSPLSRNRRFGELTAEGRTVEEAKSAIGEAIEGLATAPIALELAARHGVELPICEQVAAVVGGRKTVMEAMAGLLSRPLKAEAAWPG
ncbi:MAG: NAD(P)H-dependent glycerol-3-phosphate dehydrogenase [bacterium]